MTASHPHKWTDRVHTYMLKSMATVTSQEIEAMFGRPTSSAGTGMRINDAARDGWFEVVDRSQRPFRYRAVAKESTKKSYKPHPNAARALFGQIEVSTPQLWPSVFAYAALEALPGIPQSRVEARVHVCSDEDDEAGFE